MKRILSLFAVLILGLVLSRGWHHWTDGFKVHKVQPHFISSHQTDVIPKEIFHQSFHYLAKGRQAYVFESSDHQIVLKLLRTHSFSPPFWSRLPISSVLLKRKREKTERKRDFWLSSFSLASDELKEETVILYSHLGQTQNLPQTLVLYDKLGRKISIDPNRYLFQIQTKVTLQEEALMSAEDLAPIIRSFLNVIAKRMKRGITNESRSYFKNLGFYEGKVVEFDVGEFLQKERVPVEEFVRFAMPFREWLEENRPSSLPVFDEEFNRELSSYPIGS